MLTLCVRLTAGHRSQISEISVGNFSKNFFLIGKSTCQFVNIIMKLKVALYSSSIEVPSLHFTFIYEKLYY